MVKKISFACISIFLVGLVLNLSSGGIHLRLYSPWTFLGTATAADLAQGGRGNISASEGRSSSEKTKAADLTPEEKSWLAQHKDIRLGVDPTWPPFEFLEETG